MISRHHTTKVRRLQNADATLIWAASFGGQLCNEPRIELKGGRRWRAGAGRGEALGAGAALLGPEALAGFSTGGVDDGPATFDVTAPVQDWVNGVPDPGWALLPLSSNGWDFHTRAGATPPQLTVTFVPPSG